VSKKCVLCSRARWSCRGSQHTAATHGHSCFLTRLPVLRQSKQFTDRRAFASCACKAAPAATAHVCPCMRSRGASECAHICDPAPTAKAQRPQVLFLGTRCAGGRCLPVGLLKRLGSPQGAPCLFVCAACLCLHQPARLRGQSARHQVMPGTAGSRQSQHLQVCTLRYTVLTSAGVYLP
jgi:hypothetical protein